MTSTDGKTESLDTQRLRSPNGSFATRGLRWLKRNACLSIVRLLHPGARFGGGTDVRSRLCLKQAKHAIVAFGRDCILDNDLTVEVSGVLQVGERVIFGHHCTIAAIDRIEIGDDCMFAEMVSIRDHDHSFERRDVPYREQGMKNAPVKIGRNVWLGAKVTVIKGVTIGDNVVVGANAVVTGDIPANSLAVGIPARVVRLFS